MNANRHTDTHANTNTATGTNTTTQTPTPAQRDTPVGSNFCRGSLRERRPQRADHARNRP